jgi:hypothetical protein
MPRLGIVSVVARKLRIEYPGAVYHGMNHGDRRDAIFHGEHPGGDDPAAGLDGGASAYGQ